MRMELEPQTQAGEWTTARSGNPAQPEDGAEGAWKPWRGFSFPGWLIRRGQRQ